MLIRIAMFAALVLSGCATDKAAEVRQDRPFSAGLLGVGFRPNADVSLDVDGSFFSEAANGFSTESKREEYDDRNGKANEFHVGLSARKFIWSTSAFFLGISYGRTEGKVKFDADTATDLKRDRDRVSYSRKADYIGLPIGWYWIWENGFTLVLDFGPNFRVGHSTAWDNEGQSDINASKRDGFRDDIEDSQRFTIGGRGLIGYSF